MSRDSNPTLEGEVISEERTHFVVLLDDKKTKVKCRLGGKMKMHSIKVLVGDRVQIKVGIYDLSNGFIIFRYR